MGDPVQLLGLVITLVLAAVAAVVAHRSVPMFLVVVVLVVQAAVAAVIPGRLPVGSEYPVREIMAVLVTKSAVAVTMTTLVAAVEALAQRVVTPQQDKLAQPVARV